MSYYFAKTIEAPFADAVARAKAALSAQGFGVLSEIDVAGTMKVKLNIDLAPYLILGACNPHYAHRALEVEPNIGAMLPCNVIVREAAPGRVVVAAIDPVATMQAVGNEALTAVAQSVRALLQNVIASV